MFQGSSRLTLDDKNRFSVPTKHREALGVECEGRLTLTRYRDLCLLVYPRPVWEERLQQLSRMSDDARGLQRRMMGSAVDVDIDGSGRVLVSPELRQAAHLERDLMLIGMGTHFELWDYARWAEQDARDLAAPRSESEASFTY